MASISSTPPRAPPVKYSTPLGTRWEKEKEAAGGAAAFDLPTDPKELGPWILGECVGKGASGRVKIAKHKRTGQLAAVKILPIAPLISSRASQADEQIKSEKYRLGIDREITMMKLMNHPNILRIYDVYEGSDELFLVLEYVEGGELFDFLVNNGRLSPPKALAFFKQIIYGLNYAHTFSIIHRDLKPENILIASLNPPLLKIADWGMAAFAPPSLQLETSCGSPHYASPEIVNGEKYQGNSTDIWSCGVILYALLTGRLPFDDKNVKVLLNKVKSGKYEMPSGMDPLAKDLIARMLVIDSKKRITIPEILDHPWLRSAISSTIGLDGRLVGDTPPLPPSPTFLAQPIADPSLIDLDLLASLRIIWGRHSDPDAENIKRDLCSPAGHGIHAKAYYFLLGEYRKTTSKFNEELDGASSSRGLGARSLTFNLGWELDTSNLGGSLVTKYSTARGEMVHVGPRAPTPGAVSGLAPPTMSRNSSSSRGRPMTPAGPRLPNVPGYPPRSRNPSQPNSSFAMPDMSRAASSRGSTTTSGPRPPPPRRGYTISHLGKHDTITSSVQFSDAPLRTSYQYASSRCSRPRSATTDQTDEYHSASGVRESSAKQTMSRNKSSEEPRRVQSVRRTRIPSPVCPPPPLPSNAIHAPVPVRVESIASPSAPANADTPLSLLSGPKTANMELQKTMDRLAEQVNELTSADRDQDISAPTQAPATERCVKPSRVVSIAREKSDKENRNTANGSWYHASAEEGKSRAGNVNVNGKGMVFADNGNVNVSANDKVRKDKDRKSRPPPLEFSTLNRKRSTLGSPIALSPPTMSATVPKTNLASPVVGEFKGWLSNLFGRKSSSGAAILYSYDDVYKTRRDVISFLESVGVVIDLEESVSGNDSCLVVQCRVEDSPTDALAHLNMKPVRFKVEVTSVVGSGVGAGGAFVTNPAYSPVTPASNSGYFLRARGNTIGGGRSPCASPLPSPSPTAASNGSGSYGRYVSAIVLHQEKGSATTFKAIWRRLRERYEDGSGLATAPLSLAINTYPSPASFSPMPVTTPTMDHAQRFAV
ncbi:serine/threonine-protein kinase gin4 [Stygiomarasmius scandens]|uniref:Serine/threonine-protein kinase gin4 n=1 Tax=Marasmiellus scandens TaxID=2682957 RepID=A0ABR1JL62_9AGAR